jgi:23S rRNA pseudouridine2605 synthase
VVDLREGKNREVKTVLEHLGLDVNRLIRVSFGPFQLGDLPEGEVDEIRSRVLKDQLGEELIAKAGVDFEAPRRDEMPAAPPRRPAATIGRAGVRIGDRDGSGERERWQSDAVRTPSKDDRSEKPWKRTVWRDAEAEPQRERKAPPRRGADPKLERQTREATGEVVRRRDKAIADPNGRRVLVERVSVRPASELPARSARPARASIPSAGPTACHAASAARAGGRPPRTQERASSGERPIRRPREDAGGRDRASERPGRMQRRARMRAPRSERPERAPRDGSERPARRFTERAQEPARSGRAAAASVTSRAGRPRAMPRARASGPLVAVQAANAAAASSFGDKSGAKPSGGRPFGGKPGGGGRPGWRRQGSAPRRAGRGKRD